MPRLQLWHGSDTRIGDIEMHHSADGGFHVGTRNQAITRARGVLHEIEADITRIRRSRDTGGNWKRKVRDARSRGFDAIVYLNRYEGIPQERFDALMQDGILDRLDAMGDKAFRQLVPEAQDSYIILRPEGAHIVNVIDLKATPKKECENTYSSPGI
ncbi:hypothetical protein KUV57_12815 [Epibacterium sp. DP7N7-1]|nr:hypothetical protein [Epibacterium sp. DP7N7-1]